MSTYTIGKHQVIWAVYLDASSTSIEVCTSDNVYFSFDDTYDFWGDVAASGILVRPFRPSQFHTVWNNSLNSWEIDYSVFTPYLLSRISEYRKSLESSVVTYEGHSSFCDKESVNGIDECINNIMDNGGSKTISWEGPSGYTEADLEGLSGLRKNVVDYRQKTRVSERLTIERHVSTPFLEVGDAISFFDTKMGE